MRPSLVVKLPPLLDQHLGFGAAAEPFAVRQLVMQLAVEAFDEPVLPWATGRRRIPRKITVDARTMAYERDD
jgi:hypothetical protein